MFSGEDFGIGFAVGFPAGIVFTALVIRFGPYLIMNFLSTWSALSSRCTRG